MWLKKKKSTILQKLFFNLIILNSYPHPPSKSNQSPSQLIQILMIFKLSTSLPADCYNQVWASIILHWIIINIH